MSNAIQSFQQLEMSGVCWLKSERVYSTGSPTSVLSSRISFDCETYTHCFQLKYMNHPHRGSDNSNMDGETLDLQTLA
jgi:hypothetical protein